MTRAMALELAPHRIRVNAIAPGLTDTAQPRYGSSEAELAEASDEAGYVTGQTLHVNGGSYFG